MSIEGRENDIVFLGKYKFIIPYFQREYIWGKRNWIEFYNNFFENSKPGFIGSIILKKQIRTTLTGERCDVIDGQQRLTTLSIFLKALYDTLSEDEKQGFKNKIESILYNEEKQENGKYEKVPRLELSHKNRSSYNNVLNNQITINEREDEENSIETENLEYLEDDENEDIPENYDRIIECYKYFYSRASKEQEKRKEELMELLIHKNEPFFVTISLDADDDEQKVFDTLNTAGLRLTLADTIKNYLFHKVSELNDGKDKSTEEIYNQTWYKTFEKDDEKMEEKDKAWNKKIVTGRIERTNIDLFLYSYAIIKDIYGEKDNIDKLTNIYKKYINGFNDIDKLKEAINDLCDYANTYCEYFIGNNYTKQYKYSKEIEDILDRLLLMKNTTFYPYILYILKKYMNNRAKLQEELHNVEKLVFSNIIYGNGNKAKNYNKLSQQFIRNDGGIVEEIKSIESIYPKGLYSISNVQAKLLLFIIELYRRRDEKTDIRSLTFSSDFQLEHIMPQKWKENWSTNLSLKNDHGENLSEEQQKMYRKEKIYAIGNMTILSGSLNNKIKNSPIDIKIKGIEGKYAGIEQYSTLLITTKDVVEYYKKSINKHMNIDEIWTEERINERTEKLFKELKNAVLFLFLKLYLFFDFFSKSLNMPILFPSLILCFSYFALHKINLLLHHK